MSGNGALAGWKRSREEDHYQRTDLERMAEGTGIADPKILSDLQQLGFTHETVKLLELVPLLQVAWVDGRVTVREGQHILAVAQVLNISGVTAHLQLSNWLRHRPSKDFFERTLRVIRHMLQVMPPERRIDRKHFLLSHCASVAATSGGIFGLGSKISRVEKDLLDHFTAALENKRETK